MSQRSESATTHHAVARDSEVAPSVVAPDALSPALSVAGGRIDRLRALVAEWRKEAKRCRTFVYNAEGSTLDKCADELDALVSALEAHQKEKD